MFFGAYSGLTRAYWAAVAHHNAAAAPPPPPARDDDGGGDDESRDHDDDHDDDDARDIPMFFCWLNGGLAGSLSWAAVFPADAVKSLQQTSAEPLTLAQATRRLYTGTTDRRNGSGCNGSGGGIRAFYRGCLPAVLRGFPANAALFAGACVCGCVRVCACVRACVRAG